VAPSCWSIASSCRSATTSTGPATSCDEASRSCTTPAGAPCPDDADACTSDACDGGGQCVHSVIPDCGTTTTTVPPPTGAGAPCWKTTARRFRYRDTDLAPDGLATIVLRKGKAGGIAVRGRASIWRCRRSR
jgi:hypothetical protein